MTIDRGAPLFRARFDDAPTTVVLPLVRSVVSRIAEGIPLSPLAYVTDAHGSIVAVGGDPDAGHTSALRAFYDRHDKSELIQAITQHGFTTGHGDDKVVRIHLVGGRLLLTAVFPSPLVGVVGVRLREAVRDLETILSTTVFIPPQGGNTPASPAPAHAFVFDRIGPSDLKRLLA